MWEAVLNAVWVRSVTLARLLAAKVMDLLLNHPAVAALDSLRTWLRRRRSPKLTLRQESATMRSKINKRWSHALPITMLINRLVGWIVAPCALVFARRTLLCILTKTRILNHWVYSSLTRASLRLISFRTKITSGYNRLRMSRLIGIGSWTQMRAGMH